MFLNNAEIYTPEQEARLQREITFKKFKSYAREKFSGSVKFEHSFEEYERFSARHFSLRLPEKISEFFIDDEETHFFLAAKNPLVYNAELFIKQNPGLFSLSDTYWEIKNLYKLWIKQKNESDKKYYVDTIIKIIERNYEYFDFLSLLHYSVICARQNNTEMLNKAVDTIVKIQTDVDALAMSGKVKERLYYFTSLLYGFVNLKLGNNETALQAFTEAKKYKVNPISALFYESLVNIKLGNRNIAFNNIKRILEFDRLRLEYALEINSEPHFNFFVKEAMIYHIFKKEDFACMLEDIKILVESLKDENKKLIKKVFEQVVYFLNSRDSDLCNVALREEIMFLKNVLEKYYLTKNLFVISSAPVFRDKFNTLIDKLIAKVSDEHEAQIMTKLSLYETQIEQVNKNIEKLVVERTSAIQVLNDKLKKSISKVEEMYDEQIKALERRIKYLADEDKYNPVMLFKDAIMFSAVIAMIVFVVGGLASGYSSASGSDSVMKTLMLSGFKWGGITFIIGLIISVLSASSGALDKTNKKQQLVKEISKLKNMKEEQIERLNKEINMNRESMESNFSKKEKMYNEELQNILKEKAAEESKLREEAAQEIEERLAPFKKLYIR